jgi:hypothetical protein
VTDGLNEISSQIGELKGRIDGLREARLASDARQTAAHFEISTKLSKIDEKLVCLALLKDHVETHGDRIAAVELIAKDYTERKHKLLGGAGILAFVGAGAAWLINRLWP